MERTAEWTDRLEGSRMADTRRVTLLFLIAVLGCGGARNTRVNKRPWHHFRVATSDPGVLATHRRCFAHVDVVPLLLLLHHECQGAPPAPW